MKDIKFLSVRMDRELYGKFRYVAEYEGRSMNSQALLLIRKCVREFEEEYGAIPKDDAK